MKSKNLEKFDKKSLTLTTLALGVVLYLLLSAYFSSNNGSIFPIFISIVIVGCCLILVLLTLIDQNRFWWAPRGIALFLAISVLLVIIYAIFLRADIKLIEYVALAFSFFVLFIPSLFFVLWGGGSGKPVDNSTNTSHKNVRLSFVIDIVKQVSFIMAIILGAWLLIDYLIL